MEKIRTPDTTVRRRTPRFTERPKEIPWSEWRSICHHLGLAPGVATGLDVISAIVEIRARV